MSHFQLVSNIPLEMVLAPARHHSAISMIA